MWVARTLKTRWQPSQVSESPPGGNGTGVLSVAYLRALGQVAQVVGVPAVVLFLVLSQLTPRIDHGIQVADRVDEELTVLIARGCGAVTTPP